MKTASKAQSPSEPTCNLTWQSAAAFRDLVGEHLKADTSQSRVKELRAKSIPFVARLVAMDPGGPANSSRPVEYDLSGKVFDDGDFTWEAPVAYKRWFEERRMKRPRKTLLTSHEAHALPFIAYLEAQEAKALEERCRAAAAVTESDMIRMAGFGIKWD